MARANFVKAAQKDIYVSGKRISYISKKGKREGQEKSKIDRTVPSGPDDKILIKKGESYYWWQFKNGGKNISKGRPKPSQLTQSNYLSQLYAIQETIGDLSASDASDLESMVDEIKSDLENLKDETEGSLSNMPESLQSGPTGELLQERIDALDNAISELEGIDLDYEEPDDDDLRDELKDEIDSKELPDDTDEDGEPLEDYDEDEERKKLVTDERIEERKQELLDEWICERVIEIQDISFEG